LDEIIFPNAKPLYGRTLGAAVALTRLEIKADQLLARNIRALLRARREDDAALALWCGHRPAWLSKILNGERGIRIKDLGRIADFFGIQVADLFHYGIDPLLERRKGERRTPIERRTEIDRRQMTDGARKATDAPQTRPLPDPAIAVANRLTALAEQLETVAAAYLSRYAATLGDPPTDRPEGDSDLRSPSRRARTRKAG